MDNRETGESEGDSFAWEVIEALGQGVTISESDGQFEYVNPAYAQMVGRSFEELVELTAFDIVYPDDHDKLREAREKRLAGEAANYEIRLVKPDDSLVYVQVTSVPRWQADKVVGAFAIVTDLTERKQAEEARRQSEERYRSTLDNMLEGCQIIGFDWRYLYVNSAVARQGNQTKEGLLGHTMMEVYPGIDQTEMFSVLRRCMDDRASTQMENEFIFPDGSKGWFELSIQPVPEGIFILSFDITESKKSEEALRQREAQLQHIIDTIPEGVFLLDADASVRLTNPIAEQYLAILAPEWEKGPLTHLGHRPLNELLTSPPKGLWHEIKLNNRVFEAIARPIEISSENTGWVVVLLEVTQERNIQQRVQRQERLAAVGQLAAGIAHDFNNIMAVIRLYTQLILRSVEMPPRPQERLRTIEQQALRATDLIQQILDFSRQSVLELLPLDLLPFMKELVKLLERTLPEHIQIELNYTENVYPILADPSRIQQVIMNLAVNARDAMSEGGLLKINLAHVYTEKAKALHIREMPPGEWIEMQVIDNGSGIPLEDLSNIFEPFFTTKEVGKGTGLGLAQVLGIIQKHDGYIDVKTRAGQGTAFHLYFPALKVSEVTPVLLDKSLLQQGKGQLILLVEDNSATRQALVDSLEYMNYEVIEATNGREALTILATQVGEIALVLSDAVMPEMGGVALLHAMRQRKLNVPIVLLTGHPLSKEMENLQTLGLAGWMPKPPDLIDLSHLLAQVLTGKL